MRARSKSEFLFIIPVSNIGSTAGHHIILEQSQRWWIYVDDGFHAILAQVWFFRCWSQGGRTLSGEKGPKNKDENWWLLGKSGAVETF